MPEGFQRFQQLGLCKRKLTLHVNKGENSLRFASQSKAECEINIVVADRPKSAFVVVCIVMVFVELSRTQNICLFVLL